MTSPDSPVDRAPGSRLGYLARAALTLNILVGLISVLGDDRLPEIILQVSLAAFLVSMALNIVASIVLPAVVSFVSAKQTSVSMSLVMFIVINFTIRFYTLILPRASATAVRWFKYRAAGTGASAATLVVLEKVVQVFSYGAIAALFMVVERQALGRAAPVVLTIAAGLVLISGIGLIALFTDRIDFALARLGFVTRIPWIGTTIHRLIDAVVSQRGRPPWQVVSLIFWNALGYAFFVASAWVIAHEFGIAVSVSALAWIRGLVFLGTLIPITIAGAGIREAGFVGFLSSYGVDESTALAFALALLGVQMAIGAIGGLLELASSISKKPDLQLQPGQAPHGKQ
ncbi:MAG: flippase-like domain-containing protein [Acidimicrobiia bacterium]|nr:flippase-like domain-containing protein [Acidimicrobiia bacterium]